MAPRCQNGMAIAPAVELNATGWKQIFGIHGSGIVLGAVEKQLDRKDQTVEGGMGERASHWARRLWALAGFKERSPVVVNAIEFLEWL